jgi:hypothetical protein
MALFVGIMMAAARPAAAQPHLGGGLPEPLLPADNWWNVDISGAPLEPNGERFIDFINNGGNRRLHPDWGNEPYGIPYCTVAGDQPPVEVTFQYDDESDVGAPGRPPGYPIPEEAKTQAGWIEGFVAGGGTSGDRHLLVVDRDNRILYELFALRWVSGRWQAGSGAIWPLDANWRRPDTWTSADAAGLAILPGLVRFDEAHGDEPIRHAFRFTARATDDYYVWPASHRAGSTDGAPPFGMRLRMKAEVDLSGYAAPAARVFQAMKTYGLILADNGSDMYITGAHDERWDMDLFVPAFHGLHANDFEAIELGWQPEAGVGDWKQYP